jgi:hypothetical protein
MAVFKLPLSGDVVQNISPFTAFMSPIGSQFGLINVTLGESSSPGVEGEVLSEIGTYGKQLGKIGDALIVLLAHMPDQAALDHTEKEAIAELKEMLDEIANVKIKHKRTALRPKIPAQPQPHTHVS